MTDPQESGWSRPTGATGVGAAVVGPDSGDVESDGAAAPGSDGGEDVDVGPEGRGAGEEDLAAARRDGDVAVRDVDVGGREGDVAGHDAAVAGHDPAVAGHDPAVAGHDADLGGEAVGDSAPNHGLAAGAWLDASEDLTASAPDDIRRLDEIDAELAGVDAALRRLSDGTYGVCELCGAALDGDALHRNPLTTRCPDHAA